MKISLITILIAIAFLSGCATTNNDLVCSEDICKPKGFTIINKGLPFDEIKRDLNAQDAFMVVQPSLSEKSGKQIDKQ